MNSTGTTETQAFANGLKARSSETKPRYDLIEEQFLREIAEVMGDGVKRYGPDAWKYGDAPFIVDRWNHIIEHLQAVRTGRTDERHAINAACGLMFLHWYQQQRPDVFREAFGGGEPKTNKEEKR